MTFTDCTTRLRNIANAIWTLKAHWPAHLVTMHREALERAEEDRVYMAGIIVECTRRDLSGQEIREVAAEAMKKLGIEIKHGVKAA